MADNENWNVQSNFKVGDNLFNFRGSNVEEVAVHLEAFAENADRIFEAFTKVKQVTLAKGLGGFTSAPSSGTPNNQNTAPAAGASANTLRCKHGVLKSFNGKTKKNGDPYQFAYYCAAPFGASDACFAKDLPGQQPWSATA